MHRGYRWLIAGFLATVVSLAVPGAAWAECGPGAVSGSDTLIYGPTSADGASNGSATWNGSTNVMSEKANGFSLGSGRCETTYFDWGIANHSHYDARAARTCDSGHQASTGVTDQSQVAGVQKLGVCYGLNNQQGTCDDSSYAVCSVDGAVNPSFPNSSTRAYVIDSSGAAHTYTGGSPTSS